MVIMYEFQRTRVASTHGAFSIVAQKASFLGWLHSCSLAGVPWSWHLQFPEFFTIPSASPISSSIVFSKILCLASNALLQNLGGSLPDLYNTCILLSAKAVARLPETRIQWPLSAWIAEHCEMNPGKPVLLEQEFHGLFSQMKGWYF